MAKKAESPGTGKKRTYRTSKASDYQRKISVEDERKIIRAIISENTVLETDTEEQAKAKETVNQKFKEYGLSLALPVFKKRNQNKAPEDIKMPARIRHLTLEDIPDLLKATSYGYRDVFEIVMGEEGERASIGWYSETAARMADICDKLNEETRQIVFEKINALVPPVLWEMVKATDQPLIRAYRVAFARQTYSGETFKKRIASDNYSYYLSQRLRNRRDETVIKNNYKLGSLSEFYSFCNLYSLSIHLVMGLDEMNCVLARNGTTEMILDAFCLLPPDMQQTLADSLAMIA